MKFLSAASLLILGFVGGSLAVPSPEPQGTACLAVCNPNRPICPAGQAPTGGPGCWGCCQSVGDICKNVCLATKPTCPFGYINGGSEGCWGCCLPQPIICTLQCRLEKPVCAEGYEASGSEGCWGCCQPKYPIVPVSGGGASY
ncbi:hypothetical protein BDQ17DRAFT_1297920 [Cyathus striatus]|nr:hypothetical protein BDQ17DRAFT_1297920 [Cyathus striatus]